jgi:hypothetical protein
MKLSPTLNSRYPYDIKQEFWLTSSVKEKNPKECTPLMRAVLLNDEEE